MKSTQVTTETDNLVLFPSAKNFSVNANENEKAEDLVESLLNEFSHFSDEDIPAYLDDRFLEDESFETEVYDSLEAFMNRNKGVLEAAKSEVTQTKIDVKIAQIKEAQARIKFYLDEMEMFLPNRH